MATRQYKLLKWQERVSQFAEHSEAKNLRDEIGILRMMLEERLNMCTDSQELMMHSSVISSLVEKIERTVLSCHKLEDSMGSLLDKSILIQFADRVISIVSEVFANATPEQMTRLGLQVVACVTTIGKEQEAEPPAPSTPLPTASELTVDDDEQAP